MQKNNLWDQGGQQQGASHNTDTLFWKKPGFSPYPV